MDKKRVDLLLCVSASACALLALLLLISGIVFEVGVFTRIVVFSTFVIVLLLGAELGYLFLLNRDVKVNYFLFDTKFNLNKPVSKLTYEEIDRRMNKYMSALAPSEGKFWTDGILERTDIPSEYRPIVAYKLLFDIAQHDSEAGWKCFVVASDKTVDYIAESVALNNEADMARVLRALKSAKPLNMRSVRDFLVGNKKYIKKKLYNYVVANIDKF